MANIPSNRDYMNNLEVAQDAPITEALMNKLSANINDYLDKSYQAESFSVNGSWLCPEQVTAVILVGCGGGGGGGGGGDDGTSNGGGGAGGNGAPVTVVPLSVTPGQTYTVEIGTGGSGGSGGSGVGGNGTVGSSGGISYFKLGSTILAKFYGASGGGAGQGGTPSTGAGGTNSGLIDYRGFQMPGGNGSAGFSGDGTSGITSPYGGAAGSSAIAPSGAGGGGGSIGDGGTGSGANSGSGTAGIMGGGGGGGGGGRTGSGFAGKAGGNGAVIIYFYGNS